ncbi:PREDICTED: P2X purinoceptor 4-like [Priapulus caudatus]|uniref:P2X purinoceptor 4-like n=1 Tax=Priapulus caudatus TaxID=37621 RepID=A0ABM1F291_PRICU|nr:PREDICTED: P2X purinoceptor 4-like [Priapulus caudatus]
MGVLSYARRGVAVFFEYDTPRIVHIRSKKVGVINRIIQFLIVAYIVGYVIIYSKGYQKFGGIDSAVTTKVKGTIYTNVSGLDPLYNNRIWDVGDYIQPAQENGAFFVMTNVIITPNQTQGECAEDPAIMPCDTADNCTAGEQTPNGNGVMTGECVSYPPEPTLRSCEIHAWCPVELDELPLEEALLKNSSVFTVLLKNSVEFPQFGIKRRNILNTMDSEFLHKCRYDPNNATAKLCPVFELGVLASSAGQDYAKMAIKGGVMEIVITWDCNFDRDVHECISAIQLLPSRRPNDELAKGYNFRYAHYYYTGDVQTRVLYKAYGIRFMISVTGQAGKFNIIPLATNIGAGLALLGIATICCDVVVLYLLNKRDFYYEKKYLTVKDQDAFLLGEEDNGPPDAGSTR